MQISGGIETMPLVSMNEFLPKAKAGKYRCRTI